MALKRALRLRKSKDFQRVKQQGRSRTSRLLVLTFAPNDLATLRVGYVVSQRVSKRAVERNYVKRLLSEAIRPILVKIPPGWDLVISAKTSIIGVKLLDLAEDLRMVLRRAQLLNPSATLEMRS